jgi:hypothetical protein
MAGAFLLGGRAFVATRNGDRVATIAMSLRRDIRAVEVDASAGTITPVRTGGRVWLLLSTTSGRRLVPVGDNAMVVGPLSVPIAPPHVTFGSVRVAIDGAGGAASWLEGSRLVWRRLVCRE